MKTSFFFRDRQYILIALLSIFTASLTGLSVIYGYEWGRHDYQEEFWNQCPSFTQSATSIWDTEHVPNPPPVYQERKFVEISNMSSFKSVDEAIRDASWQSLLTPGGGFLYVKESDGSVNGYGVSMFHQLHCLIMIRDMLLGQPMSHEHEASDWTEDSMHWLHCLDYLAQGVMCAADDTIEKPGFTRDFHGKLVEGIDGMGHIHQCRDSELLKHIVTQSEQEPRPEELLGGATVFKIPGRDSKGKAWIVSES